MHSLGAHARALLRHRARMHNLRAHALARVRISWLWAPAGCLGGYQQIVIDPPWENASVKRSGRYQQLPARQLLKLPVPRLLHPVGDW